MKSNHDLVAGWVKKAQSDLSALEGCLQTESFDAACFHAQQAVEKYLKAFLVLHNKPFPFTHNLVKLIELCAAIDPDFTALVPLAESLTAYAVELRYDAEFWPSEEEAERARELALRFQDFISGKLSSQNRN